MLKVIVVTASQNSQMRPASSLTTLRLSSTTANYQCQRSSLKRGRKHKQLVTIIFIRSVKNPSAVFVNHIESNFVEKSTSRVNRVKIDLFQSPVPKPSFSDGGLRFSPNRLVVLRNRLATRHYDSSEARPKQSERTNVGRYSASIGKPGLQTVYSVSKLFEAVLSKLYQVQYVLIIGPAMKQSDQWI